MGKTLDFEYYCLNRLCTCVHVDYSTNSVEVKNYTDDPVDQAFGLNKVTIDSIDDFFRDRVFPETRVDCEDILKLLGLNTFDAEMIARKTHGTLVHDCYWIKFKNDPYNYEDYKMWRKQLFTNTKNH